MNLEANIIRTAPTLGFICDISTETKAAAEQEEYDYRMISPGYYLCVHGEHAYAMSAYLTKTGCACPTMTYRLKGDDACKHIRNLAMLPELPLKPIDREMKELLEAAGWIGHKLHPPAPPSQKRKKLPNAHDPARKPQPQAATRARKHDEYAGKTTEQIVRAMPLKEVEKNAGKGGVACVAELRRRTAAGVV